MEATSRRWARAGGVGGILFVVSLFVLISVGPLTNPTSEPAFNAPSSALLAYAKSDKGGLYPLALVGIAGMFGFLLFAAVLIAKFRDSQRAMSAPSILVVLATAVFTALWLAEFGVTFAGQFRRGDLDPMGASVFYGLANGIFVVSWAAITGFLATAGVAALSSGTLPRWLAWSGLGIGAALLLAVAIPLTAVWLLPYLLFYVWVVAVSVVLLRS
jgi:hypothetical protein